MGFSVSKQMYTRLRLSKSGREDIRGRHDHVPPLDVLDCLHLFYAIALREAHPSGSSKSHNLDYYHHIAPSFPYHF